MNDDLSNSNSEDQITRLLSDAGSGSVEARELLIKSVYAELRIIAASQMRHERQDHTLGATALVNESYLRLIQTLGGTDPAQGEPDLTSYTYLHRHAFFKAAATAMRRILIDHARSRAAQKRGGQVRGQKISVDLMEATTFADPHDLLSLDDALCRLEGEDERAASVVRLRFFAGRQIDEIAEMLEVSSRTIKRDWEFARARLQQLIEEQDGPDGPQ